MYEIISAIILVILVYLIHSQAKRIDVLLTSQEQFYTAYTAYIKAVGEHNDVVHDCIDKLGDKSVTSYYAITSLAAHVEYLEKRVNELEEKFNAL